MIETVLQHAYPGYVVPAPGKWLTTDEALLLARTYVNEHYPQCSYALLFGSFSRGTQHRGSDLDILIIFDKLPSGQSSELRRIIYKQTKMEVFLLSEESVRRLMARQAALGLRVFIDAAREGVLLTGDAELAAALSQDATARLPLRVPPPNDPDTRRIRAGITDNLLKFSLIDNPFDRIELGILLCHRLALAMLKNASGEAMNVDRVMKKLQTTDPIYADSLKNGLLKLCAGQGDGDLLAAMTQGLERLGGPIWYNENQPLLPSPIQMPTTDRV